MRTRLALLACLLALSPALARSAGTITPQENSTSTGGGKSDQIINIAECNGTVSADTLRLTWTLGGAVTGTPYYRLYATTSTSCLTNSSSPKWPPTGTFHEITSNWTPISSQTGSWPNAIDVLSELTTPLAVNCATSSTILLCLTVFDGSTTSANIQDALGASYSLQVDAAAPGQPTAVSAASGDGALTVSWTDGSPAASTWEVKAEACTPGATATVTKDCSSSGCRIGGLTNDACYNVTVTGYSTSNNPSIQSDAVAATPHPVDSFWDTYQRAGGREQGGCSGGSASALALLVLATSAPRLRRRRS